MIHCPQKMTLLDNINESHAGANRNTPILVEIFKVCLVDDCEISRISASVVVPTFNRANKLIACLRSLQFQSFCEPWEVVVVDDGSPVAVSNHVLPLLDRAVSSYRDITIVRQENAGPAKARNSGVSIARGELVAFIDDDCLADQDWLQRLVTSWRASSGALVGGMTLNGLKSEIYAHCSQMIVDFVYEYFNCERTKPYFVASNNMICSKKQFIQLAGFAEDFTKAGAEDRDFCDRWRMEGWPIVFNDEAQISHFHYQDLQEFISLHVRYGRGAYLYQRMRSQRQSGKINDELGFHMALPRLIHSRFQREEWTSVYLAKILFAMVVWQLSNAVGFTHEWMIQSVSRWKFLHKFTLRGLDQHFIGVHHGRRRGWW